LDLRSPAYPWALLASSWLVITGYRLITGDLDDRIWMLTSLLAYVVLPITAGGMVAWLFLSKLADGRMVGLIGSACAGLVITLANLLAESFWWQLSQHPGAIPTAPADAPDAAQTLLSGLGQHPDVIRVVTIIGLLLGLLGGLAALGISAVVARTQLPDGQRHHRDEARSVGAPEPAVPPTVGPSIVAAPPASVAEPPFNHCGGPSGSALN
jgi:hypothetical protein